MFGRCDRYLTLLTANRVPQASGSLAGSLLHSKVALPLLTLPIAFATIESVLHAKRFKADHGWVMIRRVSYETGCKLIMPCLLCEVSSPKNDIAILRFGILPRIRQATNVIKHTVGRSPPHGWPVPDTARLHSSDSTVMICLQACSLGEGADICKINVSLVVQTIIIGSQTSHRRKHRVAKLLYLSPRGTVSTWEWLKSWKYAVSQTFKHVIWLKENS